MKLRTNIFDLWIFHRETGTPEYLLYHTSREKAEKWFHGGQFWQIPGGFTGEDEDIDQAVVRVMKVLNLEPLFAWAAEHSYTYYNPRRKNIEIVPVFAVEVSGPREMECTWEHDEAGWFTAEACAKRLYFRGLKEGLAKVQEFVSEAEADAAALRIL